MSRLLEAGGEIDRRARAMRLEITHGGEPTFTVPITTAPEWRTEPLGPDKRARGEVLARALGRRLGARVDEVAGRKYEGEDTPRWCLRVARKSQIAAVIPDPGVLECNLPPARRFRPSHSFLRSLYGAAEEAGLGAFRVLHNGRVLGSGGGAHVTLGGPTFARSPFVRNPALLVEVVAYVHNHPSLSYAFVGASAGPSSQAPRVDEGGVDRLRNLRIAVATLRDAARRSALDIGATLATLGPLLADSTSNTHRAELNVEKMANLGLLELRAVEAQPTCELWLAVALTWRALVVRLAERRYGEPLRDWAGSLHDEWLMPSRMRLDLEEVLADVGLPRDLLHPCLDHRYPVLGVLEAPGIRCEVREALELWPVVGPLAAQESRASRLIDSSTDRLELRLTGRRAPRVAVLAAGRAVPCVRSGTARIGALRFRSGYPVPGSLQPLVGPQSPLELVLVDRATRAPLAGARVHSWRPGGGAYDSLPADLSEAAERRRARFEIFAPSGRVRSIPEARGVIDEEERGPTLDLLEP